MFVLLTRILTRGIACLILTDRDLYLRVTKKKGKEKGTLYPSEIRMRCIEVNLAALEQIGIRWRAESESSRVESSRVEPRWIAPRHRVAPAKSMWPVGQFPSVLDARRIVFDRQVLGLVLYRLYSRPGYISKNCSFISRYRPTGAVCIDYLRAISVISR